MTYESLMTIEEVAEYLRVKKRTVYEWIRNKKIPAIKAVGQWRFKKDKIDAWLKAHTEEVWVMADTQSKIDVAKDLRALVAEILETEPVEIDANAHFVKDLGMDSMMALEILASIEKKYRIIVPEDTLPKFTSLNKTVDIVKDILKKSNKF